MPSWRRKARRHYRFPAATFGMSDPVPGAAGLSGIARSTNALGLPTVPKRCADAALASGDRPGETRRIHLSVGISARPAGEHSLQDGITVDKVMLRDGENMKDQQAG